MDIRFIRRTISTSMVWALRLGQILLPHRNNLSDGPSDLRKSAELDPNRSPGTSHGYLKMFTARETTSTATTSEIASWAIIMSFAQGLIAETSVGLNAVAAVNERCR